MNERHIEMGGQLSQQEKIGELKRVVDSLNASLSPEDVRALQAIQDSIREKIETAEKISTEKSPSENKPNKASQVASPESKGEIGERERSLMLLKSAIDEFVKYAERVSDYARNGMMEEGRRTKRKGLEYLTSGPFASGRYSTPSEDAFIGDLRVLTGNLQKEKTISDSVDRDEVLKNARNIVPDAVAKIEPLLKEFDGWEKTHKQKSEEWDPNYSPTAYFVEMSNKICEELKKIKSEIQ